MDKTNIRDGEYSIVILWDSSKKYFDKMINDISIFGEIKDKTIHIFFKEYSDFIIDIYDFNNQKELGIFKASKMCKGKQAYNLVILTVKLYEKYSFKAVIKMKKYIRDKYKILIDNYFHDNIIHAADNEKEYEHIKKILKKYKIIN